MIRKLRFDCGIVAGDDMREIQKIFPETIDSFEQRKSFDEYYYNETDVEVTIERIELLNECWLHPTIGGENITIK